MGGMDGRPPIGMKIKRARERLRLTQVELGAAIGVSQKTIDNWEHDRSYPKSSIGALEEVLRVNLGNDQVNLGGGSGVESYADQDEADIWGMTQFTPAERRALIDALRHARST
jgi:DNA-binding XRE family transcriptional regulator